MFYFTDNFINIMSRSRQKMRFPLKELTWISASCSILCGAVRGRKIAFPCINRSPGVVYEDTMNERLGVPCWSIVYYLLLVSNGNSVFVVEAVSCSLHRICIQKSTLLLRLKRINTERLCFVFFFPPLLLLLLDVRIKNVLTVMLYFFFFFF